MNVTPADHCYVTEVVPEHLDLLGHVNHAVILTLMEQARWDLLQRCGIGKREITELGQSPVVLEVHVRYLRELRLGFTLEIRTHMLAWRNKVGQLSQRILIADESSSRPAVDSVLTFGVLDLAKRRLIPPSPRWLTAFGSEAVRPNLTE